MTTSKDILNKSIDDVGRYGTFALASILVFESIKLFGPQPDEVTKKHREYLSNSVFASQCAIELTSYARSKFIELPILGILIFLSWFFGLGVSFVVTMFIAWGAVSPFLMGWLGQAFLVSAKLFVKEVIKSAQ